MSNETIWGLKINDNDDSLKGLSVLQATYAEVVATKQVASDIMLCAIAMLGASSPSYDPLD